MLLRRLFGITDKNYINAIGKAGVIGLHMVSGIAVGTLLGWFLDKWLDTSPWCLVIFMLAGIAAGFRNVYIDTKRLVNEENKDRDNGTPPAAKN